MNCPQCGNNCSEQCDNLTIPTGQDGEDAYVYIAYADNSNGDGFSTTDQTKDFISIVSTKSQKTNDKSLHSGNWHQWSTSAPNATNSGILYLDSSDVGTSQTSFTTLTGKGYTLSAGTMDQNGDALRIKAIFRKEGGVEGADILVNIYNTNNPSNFYTNKIDYFPMGVEEVQAAVDIQLFRVDSITASADTGYNSIYSNYESVVNLRFFDDGTAINTSPDFDNDDLEIEIKARTSTGSTTITCEHTSVELIEKT